MKRIFTPVICICTFLSLQVDAALIAYEGFEYPASGVLLDATDSGAGWTGPWSRDTEGNDLDVLTAASNPTPGLTVTGNRVGKSGTGPGTGTVYSRGMTSTSFSDGDTLWFSFNMDGAADSGTTFAFSLLNGTDEKLRIGNDPTKTSPNRSQFSIVDDDGTRSQQGTVSISGSFNFPQVVIGKISFASGNESLNLWYENSLSGDNTEADLDTPVFTDLAIDDIATVDGIRLQIGNSATGQFDEIRLGTEFSDVITAIPEPSSFVLFLGSLILGILTLRRKCGSLPYV